MKVPQQQEPQYQIIVQQKQDLQHVQQIQAPQLQQELQWKSQVSSIKMTDIFEVEKKLWQIVNDEIEGQDDIFEVENMLWQIMDGEIEDQNIKSMEIYTRDKLTLDQEQMSAVKVEKADTFRGGTELLLDPIKISLKEYDNQMMKTMIFGAQTAKQCQINSQRYQDDMKDNTKSGINRKTQNSVKFQMEEDKVIEAYVTQWQGHTKHAGFKD